MSLHQQSLLLNDTDITSDDEEHIYTRILKQSSVFTTDNTFQTETFSTIQKFRTTNTQHSTAAINVQPNLSSTNHSSQIIPFYDTSFFKFIFFKVSFFPILPP